MSINGATLNLVLGYLNLRVSDQNRKKLDTYATSYVQILMITFLIKNSVFTKKVPSFVRCENVSKTPKSMLTDSVFLSRFDQKVFFPVDAHVTQHLTRSIIFTQYQINYNILQRFAPPALRDAV